ncbi:hypothetical protein [Actinomadura macrotermitis]|uniref:Uncharacterized protein n=1 Tax=Actinomadura macrotermitis TaxID=2585200 RepID=A0A7K0BZJ9_9ACTN|nr:hypothetical protein [Actinomadura macrotermitis]MQY06613.1 hypothetical protein [Actinomadura macrotermitis]
MIASPLTLLKEWRDRADEAGLHELLLLGRAVDLPFLEKTAVPMARALGARVTVIGDAAHTAYAPVDVRQAGRGYVHALAGDLRPRLALLAGEDDVVAAIGSGDPTLDGWGHNDELWTVLRGDAVGRLAPWLRRLPETVAMPGYAAALLAEIADRLPEPGADGGVRVLHDLDGGLLGQVPAGPVDELRLYAPLVDPSGDALFDIIGHFDPARVVLGLQPELGEYDGDAIVLATDGRATEIRLLEDERPRHGTLLEWSAGGRRHALVGGTGLTAALLEQGGGELAVLAPVASSLLPEGTPYPVASLEGRRTVRPAGPRPDPAALGALITGDGLQVTLARAHDEPVAVAGSPDGSPGSWEPLGTVPAGARVQVFGTAHAVVRAGDGPAVFTVQPGRFARGDDGDGPRLRTGYTEDEIFTDEALARRFRADLVRLAQQLAGHKTPGAGSVPQDRWSAYLDACERALGRPLADALFGRPNVAAGGHGWGIALAPLTDGPEPDAGAAAAKVPERTGWQRWIPRAVDAALDAPLFVRMLVARLFVQLLGHGVWDLDDGSWRPQLARLTERLAEPGEDVPEETGPLAAVLTAVCMGLLRDGAADDALSAGVWAEVKDVVATADPDLAGDLIVPPLLPRARVLTRSELEELQRLAGTADPLAHLAAALDGTGWEVEFEDGLYTVSGGFTNPVPVAARVATLLDRPDGVVLVRAVGAGGRWAFIAWRRPDLLLASHPAGNAWRFYRLAELATPESRLAGGDGISRIGMVGNPVRLGRPPAPQAQRLLVDAGTDHLALIARLTAPL